MIYTNRFATKVVIPGRCAASNPESRDSGSGPSDHPGMTLRTSPLPIHDPILVAVELHAAERTALVVIADRIRLQLGLLGHRVLAEIFATAGRPVAEFVGAVVVPPGTLVIGGAVEDFEVNVGMIEPDAAELHQILRL